MSSFVACWLITAAASAESPPPCAIVTGLKGDSTVARGKEEPRKLRRADLLWPGDKIEAGEGLVIVLLADGTREATKASAKLTVEEKGCTPAEALVRTPNNLPQRSLDALRERARSGRLGTGFVRSDNEAPPRVTPIRGATVAIRKPEFRWQAVPSAVRYRVELLSGADGKDEERYWWVETKETRLPLPADKPALVAGLKYRWRVFAIDAEDKSSELAQAHFLAASKVASESIGRIAQLADSKLPADRLLAALAYEGQGAFDLALPLFESLAKDAPTDGMLQAIVARYCELAGRRDDAAAAWKRAEALGERRPKD